MVHSITACIRPESFHRDIRQYRRHHGMVCSKSRNIRLHDIFADKQWQTFFSDLESRQKECRLYIDRIGDIVRRHATSLDVYTPYCLNQVSCRTCEGNRYSKLILLCSPMQSKYCGGVAEKVQMSTGLQG